MRNFTAELGTIRTTFVQFPVGSTEPNQAPFTLKPPTTPFPSEKDPSRVLALRSRSRQVGREPPCQALTLKCHNQRERRMRYGRNGPSVDAASVCPVNPFICPMLKCS